MGFLVWFKWRFFRIIGIFDLGLIGLLDFGRFFWLPSQLRLC